MASCATAFFILCAIIFGVPFEKIFNEDEPRKTNKRKGAAYHDRDYSGTVRGKKRSA